MKNIIAEFLVSRRRQDESYFKRPLKKVRFKNAKTWSLLFSWGTHFGNKIFSHKMESNLNPVTATKCRNDLDREVTFKDIKMFVSFEAEIWNKNHPISSEISVCFVFKLG